MQAIHSLLVMQVWEEPTQVKKRAANNVQWLSVRLEHTARLPQGDFSEVKCKPLI